MVSCQHCRKREAPGVPSMPRCTGCFHFSYCDAVCQKADRPNHKEICDRYKRTLIPGPASTLGGEAWDAAALRVAAEGGDVLAQGCLGKCYWNGLGGVAVDYVESARWYSQAASSGAAPDWVLHNWAICLFWGRGTRVDHDAAVRVLRPLAQRGFLSSQYMLACCYLRGEGVRYDPVEAFAWLERAAEAGYPSALNMAGLSLCTELGVPKDMERAMRYFRAGADAGEVNAMCNVARCYRAGLGTRKDPAAAIAWLERARDAGSAPAAKKLAEIAAGEPTPVGSDDEGQGGKAKVSTQEL